jgi:hypothetical protein
MKFTLLLVSVAILFAYNLHITNKLDEKQGHLRNMKENMYYSYASYCSKAGLNSFTCFWCNKTNDKVTVTKIFEDKATTTLGYIGYNSKSSFYFN